MARSSDPMDRARHPRPPTRSPTRTSTQGPRVDARRVLRRALRVAAARRRRRLTPPRALPQRGRTPARGPGASRRPYRDRYRQTPASDEDQARAGARSALLPAPESVDSSSARLTTRIHAIEQRWSAYRRAPPDRFKRPRSGNRLVPASGTRRAIASSRSRPEKDETPPQRGFPGAGATGLEPATSGVTGRRSNQLSYAPLGRHSMAAVRGERRGPTPDWQPPPP